MLVATSVATDSRVLREARTLAEAGHAVHIIGKQVPEGFRPPEDFGPPEGFRPPGGITVSSVGAGSALRRQGAPSLSSRPLPPHLRTARWLLLPQHRNSAFGRWARGAVEQARSLAFDAVHAHDFTALPAAAELARERGVPLVYDSHELWSGRPRVGRPTPVQTWREKREEGRLGARAAAVISVGDGVAAALRSMFGWDHVVVVRNTFPYVPPPDPGPAGAPVRDRPAGLVYAGRLAPYRELEVVAAASARLPLPVSLVGPADDTWLSRFDPGTAIVTGAVPPEQVARLLTDAGLALVTHSDRWENHRLALPNKLFHAVAAGVPVVATDVGELAAAVRRHGLGTLYRPGDAAGLVRAVEEACRRYPELVAAVRAAGPELSWEHDAKILLGVYERLAARSGPAAGGPAAGAGGAAGAGRAGAGGAGEA